MKVVFIGLGHMGMGMARNLLAAGHEVTAYDLADQALAAARDAGLATAQSGPEAVAAVDVVITMLPAGEHVLASYRGDKSDQGLLASAQPGTIFMDCSTIAVHEARQAADLARQAGHRSLDAPVSGGMMGADDGTLTFMIGGDAKDVEAVQPLTEAMGNYVVHCGPSGTGQTTKICNNMLLCINQIGAAEAFALGEKLGMDPQQLHEVIANSSGQSWSVTSNSPVPGTVANAPSNHDFEPGATPDVAAKDLGLAAAAMETAGFHCQLGQQARDLYQDMAASDYADQDFSGIINYLQRD